MSRFTNDFSLFGIEEAREETICGAIFQVIPSEQSNKSVRCAQDEAELNYRG